MTKSEMFKNAHAFTKRLIQHHHVKGTYRELFAKSLKQWHKNMKAEKAEAMAKANKPVATEISEKFVTRNVQKCPRFYKTLNPTSSC